MNTLRIVLCGIVTGVVWFLLSAVTLVVFASDFLATVRNIGTGPHSGGGYFFGVDLLMGVWTVWLYSVLAARYGAGPRAAMYAGLAWWGIKTLQSAKWVGLGVIPQRVVLVPLATSLVCAVAATLVGAWLYDKVQPRTSARVEEV